MCMPRIPHKCVTGQACATHRRHRDSVTPPHVPHGARNALDTASARCFCYCFASGALALLARLARSCAHRAGCLEISMRPRLHSAVSSSHTQTDGKNRAHAILSGIYTQSLEPFPVRRPPHTHHQKELNSFAVAVFVLCCAIASRNQRRHIFSSPITAHTAGQCLIIGAPCYAIADSRLIIISSALAAAGEMANILIS